MRSMISGAKPGPSSVIVTAIALGVPSRRDLDALAREIDGVLQQIAEPVEDGRDCARPIGSAPRSAGNADVDGDPEIAMRRHDLLDQRGQRHAVERLAAGGQLGELGEDVAAALRLLAQQPHVVGVRRVRRDARARAPWRPPRWWTAACRAHARRRRRARRAARDAARAPAPVRWRPARRRAGGLPRRSARHRRR